MDCMQFEFILATYSVKGFNTASGMDCMQYQVEG